MYSIKKSILFGFLVWLIPFLIAFGFYTPEGVLSIDKFLFKSIMLITGALVGTYLLVRYFRGVDKEFLREGILVGLTWLFINWALDLAILLPMSGMGWAEYFGEIGIRYLTIPIFSIAIGKILEQKLKS